MNETGQQTEQETLGLEARRWKTNMSDSQLIVAFVTGLGAVVSAGMWAFLATVTYLSLIPFGLLTCGFAAAWVSVLLWGRRSR